VKAVVWQGVNRLAVEEVDDPRLLDDQDAVLRVLATATCGSDLHLVDGYIPTMREGDILGHEFLGEVVETGPAVERLSVGDRVVVCSIIACGRCWHCRQGRFSLCDDSNPNPALGETLWGQACAGIFGYSHLTGGFAGSHADYVRVPFADHGCFPVPDGLADDAAVYCSDAVPTGWMGADNADIEPGDVVAVWGAGGVGQMAARAAQLMGAERVVVIDRFPERFAMVEDVIGAETLDYTAVDVHEALLEITAGRGPDRCIEAVGMEAHDTGLEHAYDRAKQALRLHTERAAPLRQAIRACRKGGTVSVLGVYGGLVDKFPLGAAMNKGLTLRLGQQHGQRYIPMLLERMAAGEIPTAHLTTHPLPLDQAPQGYDLFKHKRDGCVRAVFHP
jgi:threonine dehydrogenase-like Zn-dependent dehydrogenase